VQWNQFKEEYGVAPTALTIPASAFKKQFDKNPFTNQTEMLKLRQGDTDGDGKIN